MNLLTKYAHRDPIKLLRVNILPNLHHLPKSRLRRCRACEKLSVHLQFGDNEEFRKCARCTANLRYEMLAEYLREGDYVAGRRILELDAGTPISAVLKGAADYFPSYYRPGHQPGSVREDGVRMEDITALTFSDNSLDVIVSSDVLEHVPDAQKAFDETFRVLKPGGVHVFTVPNEDRTMCRARIVDGQIDYLAAPEFHSDPLDPAGIPVFWHFGTDIQAAFDSSGLKFTIVKGPEGKSNRVVWQARKPLEMPNRYFKAEHSPVIDA